MNSLLNKINKQMQQELILCCLILHFITLIVCERVNSANASIRYSDLIGKVSASTKPAGLLDTHNPVQGELTAGQTDSYRISISSNYYFEVRITPRGGNMTSVISDSDGKKLYEVKCTSGDQRQAFLSLIIDLPGDYYISIHSLEKREVAKYELTVESLRVANEQDKIRARSHDLYTKGAQLYKQETAAALADSIRLYTESLSAWRTLNDKYMEAETLRSIGDVYSLRSEYQKALEHYSEALRIYQASDERYSIVLTLNKIASIYLDRRETFKALQFLNSAYQTSSEIKDERLQAQALSIRGLVCYVSGNTEGSLNSFNQASDLWRTLRNRAGEAETLLQKGHLYADMSDFKNALKVYSEALELWKIIEERQGEALTLTAIGTIYSWLGEQQKALDSQNHAKELFRIIGNRNGEATTNRAIGYIYGDLGDRLRELEFYQRALGSFRTLGNRSEETRTLGYIARVYHVRGDHRKAVEYYMQKLLLSRQSKDQRMEADTLKDLGMIFNSQGNKKKALNYYMLALSSNRTVKNLRTQAYIFNDMGDIYSDLGDRDKASYLFNRSLKLMQTIGDQKGEILILYNMAHLSRDLNKLDRARALAERAINIIESLRGKVLIQELRASYMASVFKYYEFYIDILMQLHRKRPSEGYNIAALEASERARSRSLLETLIEGRGDIREGVPKELIGREREIQQQLNAKAESIIHISAQSNLNELSRTIDKEIDDLLTEYQKIQAQIKEKSPHYAALMYPSPLNIKEIQQLLDSDTLLLEYSLGEERSYGWVISNTSISSFVMPSRNNIEIIARRLFEVLNRWTLNTGVETKEKRQTQLVKCEKEYQLLSNKLSRILIGPVSSQLGNKRLVIVADGVLQYVPFGALTDISTLTSNARDIQPLIVNHEISSLPSASILAVWRRETVRLRNPTKTIAVIADPVFDKDDPRVRSNKHPGELIAVNNIKESRTPLFSRLLSAEWEASKIISMVPQDQGLQMLGFNANREIVTSQELSNYHIVHFATHGFVNSEHPELSGLVLSLVDKNGQPESGFLRLNEIYNLDLPADLVVLSACQTSLGKDVRGEGLIGLTRGFMYAGARRVIASLWKIDDRATAELMIMFYRKMFLEDRSPATALKESQVEMWKNRRWKAPYFWAGFTIQGDWK